MTWSSRTDLLWLSQQTVILLSPATHWLTSQWHQHKAVCPVRMSGGNSSWQKAGTLLSSPPEAGRALLCARHPYGMFCTWDCFASRTNHGGACATLLARDGWATCGMQRAKVGSQHLNFPTSPNSFFLGSGLLTQAGTEVLLVWDWNPAQTATAGTALPN